MKNKKKGAEAQRQNETKKMKSSFKHHLELG